MFDKLWDSVAKKTYAAQEQKEFAQKQKDFFEAYSELKEKYLAKAYANIKSGQA